MKATVYYCSMNDELCLVWKGSDGETWIQFDDFLIGVIDEGTIRKHLTKLGEL